MATARRDILIDGIVYATPFADLFRRHNRDELDSLRESLRAFGVLVPVLAYTSPVWGAAIIDGIARVTLAASLRIVVPMYALEVSDETARRIASELNAARRHLSYYELPRFAERAHAVRADSD